MGSAAILAVPSAGVWMAGIAAAASAAWLAVAWVRFVLGIVRHYRLNLPSPPETSLLLGHASPMLTDKSPLRMAEWEQQCGPIFKLRLLGQTLVILTDPAAVVRVNRIPDTKKPDMYRAFDLPSATSVSLFTDPGSPYWKAVRTGVAPCFSITSLKRTFPWLQHLCRLAVEEVAAAGDGGRTPILVGDLAARITSDTIGDMLLNKDLGGMAGAIPREGGGSRPEPLPAPVAGCPDYIALVRVYLSAIHTRMNDPLHRLRFGAEARARAAALKAWDAAVEDIARGVMERVPPEYTIAGHLLKVIDPTTGRPLSLSKLKGELSIFYIAGFETTSHAISWSLGLLASHPSVQDKLASELGDAGLLASPGVSPRDFEWSDLSRLPYLNAVIKEALRLFQPASGGSARTLPCETEVLGFKLPKGTIIAEPFYSISRSRRNYGDDADGFRPERWVKEGAPPPAAAANGSSAATGPSPGAGDGRRQGAADDAGTTRDQGRGNGADGAAAEEDGAAKMRPAGAEAGGGPPDALPFSIGSRDCVGRALAMLELQVVLATLVGRFRWELPPGARDGLGSIQPLQERVCYHITLFPGDGLPLMAVPRGAGAAGPGGSPLLGSRA